MSTELVRVNTADKLILDGCIFLPENKTDKIIINVHGVAHNFYLPGFIWHMAKKYNDSGWSFLSMNNRGHDYVNETRLVTPKEKYRIIGSTREDFKDSVLDIKAYVDFAIKKGYKKIVLQGHSLGAAKIAYYTAKSLDKRVNGLVFASPVDHVALFNTKERAKYNEELLKKAIESVKKKRKTLIPIKVVYEDTMLISPETYISLAMEKGISDIFNVRDEKAPSLLSKIRIPILAFLSKEEFSFKGTRNTLEIIKSKAVNCTDFTYSIIPGSSHTYSGHEEEVAKLVSKWLDEHF